MKYTLLFVLFGHTFLASLAQTSKPVVGMKVPSYTFSDVLNNDQKPFSLTDQCKPIVIEFWATWCSPCIPAMKKLEKMQSQYGNEVEFITVSTDKRERLLQYIERTNTTLRIAFDTAHVHLFSYRYIPHTLLVDNKGVISAITTPDKITDQIMLGLIQGNPIEVPVENEENTRSNLGLNRKYTCEDYQYTLTSENKDLTFKNEIERDMSGKPISLDFRNVSIYRLMTDIYELSSAARIYSEDEISTNEKYCFQLTRNGHFEKGVLQNAKDILNKNLPIQTRPVELVLDSVYTLVVVDSNKLPKASTVEKKYFEYRGPYYRGKKVTTYNLIEYLENEVQRPIKDKTALAYAFDMELDWNYEEGGVSLNRSLQDYGLKIKRSDSKEKVKLLMLTPWNEIPQVDGPNTK